MNAASLPLRERVQQNLQRMNHPLYSVAGIEDVQGAIPADVTDTRLVSRSIGDDLLSEVAETIVVENRDPAENRLVLLGSDKIEGPILVHVADSNDVSIGELVVDDMSRPGPVAAVDGRLKPDEATRRRSASKRSLGLTHYDVHVLVTIEVPGFVDRNVVVGTTTGAGASVTRSDDVLNPGVRSRVAAIFQRVFKPDSVVGESLVGRGSDKIDLASTGTNIEACRPTEGGVVLNLEPLLTRIFFSFIPLKN